MAAIPVHGLELWQAAVLGIVEGITEYLPVSSTGHLILAASLMGLDGRPEMKSALDNFEIVIQGGAILAVVGVYWPRMVQMLRGLVGRDPAGLRIVINLWIAFVPSAALGFLLSKQIKAYLFYPGPVLAALAVGAVYMMLVERWWRAKWRAAAGSKPGREMDVSDVRPRQALLIGLLQCVSLFPGTSRAMMTITGGYLVGLPPRKAAEFSFLLGLPTLTAATLYSLYKDFKESAAGGRPDLFTQLGPTAVAVGLIVAALSAAAAVKWLVGFLGKHGLTPFGWYRLVLCVVLGGLMWAGIVEIGPETVPAAAAPEITAPAAR